MARNVGSIEVTVDANTGRMTAKMRKDGKAAGASWADAFEGEIGDVNGRELLNRLKVLRKQAEATLTEIDVDVGLDDSQARAGIKRLEGQLRAAQLELIVNSDLDTTQLEAELAAVRAMARDMRLDMDVDIDPAEVTALGQLIDSLLGDVSVAVEADIDQSSFARAKAWIHNWAEDTGESTGKKFGGGLMSGDDTKMIIAAVASMGDALVAGMSGLVAAGTAVVSSAIQAMGAAALAATPIVVGFGAAMVAGVVGAQGFGDALKEVNTEFANAAAEGRPMNMALIQSTTAFRNLAPAAQDAAMAFADVRDELSTLRKDVQGQLFAGFADEIASMADETIPDMSDALEIAAGSLNEFGKGLADIARNTDFMGTMKALDPALDDAFDSARALVQTLEPFLKSAAGPAERLAEMIERAAEGLRDWMQSAKGQTAVTDMLDDGITGLRRWGDLLQSVGDLLVTVMDAGAEGGDNFVGSLDRMIERWDSFLESAAGQDALTEFFESGSEAIESLQPLVDGLKDAFKILITPDTMSNFGELAAAIGNILPVAAELIVLFGQFQVIEAFSEILDVLQPVLDFINGLPAPILEAVGVMIALSKAFSLVSAAAKALMATNPWLLAIAATIAVIMVAIDAFSGKADAAAERTKELTEALQGNVEAMIASGEATDGAALGMDALNKSIFETGDAGKKLEGAFQTINSGAGDVQLGMEDVNKVLMGLQDGAEGASGTLADLAKGYGLPAGPAKELADIVNSTDDNFEKAQTTGTSLGMELEALAESAGIPVEELIKLAQAMEETQDQAENTDYEKVAQEFLAAASTGSDLEQEILKGVEAMRKSGEIADTNVAAYEEYVDQLNKAKNAQDDSTSATAAGLSSQEQIQQAIDDAVAARKAEAEALKESRKAAMDTYEAEVQLASATEKAAAALATQMGVTGADKIVSLGESLRDAAAEADALTSALDLLLSPQMSLAEATSNVQANIDDLTASLAEHGATLDLDTEAGRANAEQIRTSITGITDLAAAQLTAGKSNEEVAATATMAREGLIQQSEAYFTASDAAGTAREQAENYVNSLGLTPELINTVFAQPGLMDALLNAEDLTLLYDDAGNPVITEFEAAGIDPAMAEVEGFETLIAGVDQMSADPNITATTAAPTQGEIDEVTDAAETLDGTTASPTVTVPTASGVETKVRTLQTAIDKLSNTTATPTITMPSYSGMKSNIDNLQRAMDSLDRSTATPSVSIPTAQGAINKVNELDDAIDTLSDGTVTIRVNGVQDGINKVNELDRAIDNLRDRTITVTTRNVTTTSGGMAGAMISGPRTMQVGERGYAEALVPLQLPLNRINPEVRQFAEILRGQGHSPGPSPGTGKVVNNYMTITPASADPGAVATQIINRAATLANR